MQVKQGNKQQSNPGLSESHCPSTLCRMAIQWVRREALFGVLSTFNNLKIAGLINPP